MVAAEAIKQMYNVSPSIKLIAFKKIANTNMINDAADKLFGVSLVEK